MRENNTLEKMHYIFSYDIGPYQLSFSGNESSPT